MHLEGRTNYHNVFEPTLFVIETMDGRSMSFQPSWEALNKYEKRKIEEKVGTYFEDLSDFCAPSEGTKLYRLKGDSGTVIFYYFVDPNIRAVIVPPNAIHMEISERNNGVGGQIQRFFEQLAHKLGYKLLVSITPDSAASHNQRILNIIRNEGYYMGPPTEGRGNYVGVHQSTYMGNGIPEAGIDPMYIVPPTIH